MFYENCYEVYAIGDTFQPYFELVYFKGMNMAVIQTLEWRILQIFKATCL